MRCSALACVRVACSLRKVCACVRKVLQKTCAHTENLFARTEKLFCAHCAYVSLYESMRKEWISMRKAWVSVGELDKHVHCKCSYYLLIFFVCFIISIVVCQVHNRNILASLLHAYIRALANRSKHHTRPQKRVIWRLHEHVALQATLKRRKI